VLNETVWDSECKTTVTVSAVYEKEKLEEGDHFLTLRHVVTDGEGDKDIDLSDGSSLLASNVLVRIYDYGTAGVIIQQIGGVMATAKIWDTDKAEFENVAGHDGAYFYEDEYKIRLAGPPNASVN
jgi:hypothetical protein